MASGAPVLAAKTRGVPEISNSPEIGRLVSDVPPAAFARTMVEVPTLPDRGGVMAIKAPESVGYPAPLEGESTHKP
jgi:glycosyltransferase involved in cell wall biosynthesis